MALFLHVAAPLLLCRIWERSWETLYPVKLYESLKVSVVVVPVPKLYIYYRVGMVVGYRVRLTLYFDIPLPAQFCLGR